MNKCNINKLTRNEARKNFIRSFESIKNAKHIHIYSGDDDQHYDVVDDGNLTFYYNHYYDY